MICEDCVISKSEKQKKNFELKMTEYQVKEKKDAEEIKFLKKKLATLVKDNKEMEIEHEKEINRLKAQIENESAQNGDLLNTITRLNDVVRVQDNLKEEYRLITGENQEGWKKVYQWAEKFNLFTDKLLELIPEKSSDINKILIKQEEQVTFSIQEKLSQIPKELVTIIESVQKDKSVELDCLNETKKQIAVVLEAQKATFEQSKIEFPEMTMTLALQPFETSVGQTENFIAELEDMKSECELFSTFKVELCKGLVSEDVSKSKYPLKKPNNMKKKESEPELFPANEETV